MNITEAIEKERWPERGPIDAMHNKALDRIAEVASEYEYMRTNILRNTTNYMRADKEILRYMVEIIRKSIKIEDK